ncbi:protocadherin beta-15-like [Argonauta hians]
MMTGYIALYVYLLQFLVTVVLSIDILYHVKEEERPHTYIGDIAADSNLSHSLRHQHHSLITFTQLQRTVSSGSHLFNVTNTGKLYTTETLDAESLCTYNKECSRTVKVAVRKGKTFMKILKVKIIVEDINDHSPKFPESQFTLEFGENDGIGTKKSLPNSVDKDVSVRNSNIRYQLNKNIDSGFSLLTSNLYGNIFTPEIVLEKKLDRETKSSYILELLAKDGGSPSKYDTLEIIISLKDVNDNRPIFSQDIYDVSITNSHQIPTPILTVSASDDDLGHNANITFLYNQQTSNEARKHFSLNRITGEIQLKENFIFDKQQLFHLFIEAKDMGSPSLSSVTKVQINVINTENNAPLINIDFVSPLTDSSTAVSEDSELDSFIAYVIVTDTDSGPNGEVVCDLKHDKFKLPKIDSKEYKIILDGNLDREIRDHYKVSIVCHDMGSPQLESKKYFSVKVTDVNDVEPHFTKDTFQFLTYENQKVDFPIGFINATDPDLGDGGQLTYAIINNNNNDNIPFELSKDGFISTSQSIDREMKDMYKFEVLVKDNGTPSLNNTANIVIEILDKNDNAPYFTFPMNDPYNLDVHYNPNSKKDITILKGSDKDTGNNAFLTYGILRSNDKKLFTVNSHTGVLSFSRTVYQNDAGIYDLQFILKDSGNPAQSATTVIILTLFVSNDTSPRMNAVHLQTGNDLDMSWVLVIVSAGVILSVVIVVSITLCVFKCINSTSNSSTSNNSKCLSQNEMRQMLYQTNNPVAITRNAEEIFNRNLQTIKSKSQFYQGMGQPPSKWKFSTTPRRLPPIPTAYSGEKMRSSYEHINRDCSKFSNYMNDSGFIRDSKEHLKDYEEIDGLSEMDSTTSVLPSPQSHQEQESYLEPI